MKAVICSKYGSPEVLSRYGEALNDINYLDQFITDSENQHKILDLNQ